MLAKNELLALEPDHVITGMALGWDTAIAGAAAELGIPFTAAIPFHGQDERWARSDRERYAALLSHATNIKVLWHRYGPDVYQWRDEWMVDRGDVLLALLNPEIAKSGTGMTVRYAQRKRVPILNCWSRWLDLAPPRG